MNNPDPSLFAAPAAAAVGAVLAIAQAVPTIDKRLARVRDIEQEMGRLPPLVQWYYVFPQKALRWSLLLIAAIGVAMVSAFLYRLAFPAAPTVAILEALVAYGIWLILAWFVIAIAMYTNFPSWFAVGCGFVFTTPPVLRNFSGTDRLDRHPAWPALKEFLNANESAKPLLVETDAARGFADWLIVKLTTDVEAAPNRATAPNRPSGMSVDVFRHRAGNSLLVGCVIEEAHYARNAGFPQRAWGPFYDVVAEVALQTELLTVQSIRARHLQDSFVEELLEQINQRLQSRAQPLIPSSAAMQHGLKEAFHALAATYHGTAVDVDPQRDGWWHSRWDIIRARVKAMPAPRSDSMQAQFVKLAVVWGVWTDLALDGFDFAFSKRIAALLLDRFVIRVPSQVVTLSFTTHEERQVARSAERTIIEAAIALVENQRAAHAAWLPPQSLNTYGGLFRWWLAYEFDLRMWDYSRRLHQGQQLAEGLIRWRENAGQVSRVR